MAEPLIQDSRSMRDFAQVTFHGYTKAEAKKNLRLCLLDSDQDEALFWALELLSSGLIDSLWQTLLDACIMGVHRANPKLLLYLIARHGEMQQLREAHEADMTQIRNSHSARFIVVEVLALCCASRKTRLPNWPTIPEVDDLESLQAAVVAPARHFADAVLKPEDPEDIHMAANEVAHALHVERRDAQQAMFWIRWLISYDRRLKALRDPLECAERDVPPGVDPRHCKDSIWLVWELLNHAAVQRGAAYVKIMEALFTLYVHQWEPGSKWTRKHYLAAAVAFLTDTADWAAPLCTDREAIRSVTRAIPQHVMEFLREDEEV